MNEAGQLKLQAFLDGELPEAEAQQILALTQRDPDAAKLLNELKQTRQALAQGQSQPALPESREFYWSKIRRDIEQLEPRPAPASSFSISRWLRRVLLPVATVAAAIVVALAVFRPAPNAPLAKAGLETSLMDEDAITYQDQQEGTTLVWLSYPASGNSEQKPNTHS